MVEKQRLDIALVERELAPTREKARGMIMAGEVTVNGQMVDKPGTRIAVSDDVQIKPRQRFVSRGGDKLAGALVDFGFDVVERVCADVGASTGGFTDCLLTNGAKRVYAIDVGYGILDYRLRQDERVVVMERTNARYVQTLPEAVSLVVVDASFISLKLLLPVFQAWMQTPADVIALIKPQFEAGQKDVGKGGVVKDSAVHERVLTEVVENALQQGYSLLGMTVSPLKGPAGNTEFFGWFGWKTDTPAIADAAAAIQQTVQRSTN
ncbi:MAG: TlyA family RNA methyltransferase [bacterium]|nr:TlyA family RNA methyltransferase [bacterium]